MAGDGRPRHCGRGDEAWPHGPYAYLPRGGICDNGEPRSRRPVAAGSPPGHPAHRAAGQWRSRSDAASPPGPVPARAGPDRGPGALQIAGTRPEGEGRPRGKRPLPGKRLTCRVCYTPPASAATARGDVAAGRRGRIADMTTPMPPADLAAVSSLPLVGQRAAPADYALRGRWRVRRSRAARNSRFWRLSFAGLLCPGRVACGAPARWQIRALGRERPCRWPCRAVGGRASGVDVAAGPRSASQRGREPGPGSRRPQRQPDSADGASEASPASEPFRLMEPQQVQARGYRSQSLPFSSACLINGRVVTCSCWSRSAVLI
jgi:hypothetical protein